MTKQIHYMREQYGGLGLVYSLSGYQEYICKVIFHKLEFSSTCVDEIPDYSLWIDEWWIEATEEFLDIREVFSYAWMAARS